MSSSLWWKAQCRRRSTIRNGNQNSPVGYLMPAGESGKLEFFFMIPDTSLHQHNDVGIFDLDNLFCFQPDLFC